VLSKGGSRAALSRSFRRGLAEQVAEPRQAAERPALDRAQRDAEPLRELGLAVAAVVGELECLALLVGEARERSRLAYSAGPYRPFVETVAQAARLAGVPPTRAEGLLRGMGEQLDPWPEAPEVLRGLSESVRIGVVTNCSEELGQRAAARVGVHFDTVVTAEPAGVYKPGPEPYRLGLDRLGVQPSRTLFVAGSPADITGASGAGMRVWWHNRLQLPLGERRPPLAEHHSLEPLLTLATAP
jgi:2-haloacid dehalogenase